MNRNGQVAITFNWVYVLIAGAVILMFFVGIVVKQKAVSEERLNTEVLQVLDSIFTAASVSDKTRNFVKIGGLGKEEVFFRCSDGVTEFGVTGKSFTKENAIDPIFAPSSVKAPRLILWSLPYNMPFKVVDFLLVTSSNTKYVVYGKGPFVSEFITATDDNDELLQIDASVVDGIDSVDPGKAFAVRIVDTDGVGLKEMPLELADFDDSKVTGVSFVSGGVQYYKKQGSGWVKKGKVLPIVAMDEERQAAKYAAIFAAGPEEYWCGMQKAFERLELLDEVYTGKVGEMVLAEESGVCATLLAPGDSIGEAMESHSIGVKQCLASLDVQPEVCSDLMAHASAVSFANEELSVNSCITLY